MSSMSEQELEVLKRCIGRVAKNRAVTGACIYGSKVAGYATPRSDTDLLVVLENYPYVVKYVYLNESGTEVSALVVDHRALEKDAQSAFMGEFVAGRLLHIYEPIANPEFFGKVERVYKKRVILEEINDLVRSTGILGTELLFPLEYVMFSKIKRRSVLYPNAVYSYYKTYTGEHATRNMKFALDGYKSALGEIMAEDKDLFTSSDNMLQISEKRISLQKDRAALKLTKRLKSIGSYIVHTYAGRREFHRTVREAESKIRRRVDSAKLPEFISCPRRYWKLPEGIFINDSDWLAELAESYGFDNYSISYRRRLGDLNSRTVLHVITDGSKNKKLVVKNFAKTKAVKWAALSVWTSPVKRFKVDPLLRLGSEYKAIRHIKSLGLQSLAVEAVVLDRKLLVTQFVEGKTLADMIKDRDNEIAWIRKVGMQIAIVHASGSSFGNIKPKNILASGQDLYFTDLEQFNFKAGDQVWDLAQFISWALKRTANREMATAITKEFMEGYAIKANIRKLASSRKYIESFYPVLVPSVARVIKKEIKNLAS